MNKHKEGVNLTEQNNKVTKIPRPKIPFSQLVLLFFIYSFFGWIWETIYHYYQHDELVKRGFFFGLYCPIYGFSALAVLYFLGPFKKKPVQLFIWSTLIITVLEYMTSYVLELAFDAVWWDYHDMPLNFEGRIALPVSLFWGISCLLGLKFAQPRVMQWVIRLHKRFGNRLPRILLVIILLDLAASLMYTQSFQSMVEKLDNSRKEKYEEFKQKGIKRFDELDKFIRQL